MCVSDVLVGRQSAARRDGGAGAGGAVVGAGPRGAPQAPRRAALEPP